MGSGFSSLLPEEESETEVEELEGREDNESVISAVGFTGDRGVSSLANRWRKSPATSQ